MNKATAENKQVESPAPGKYGGGGFGGPRPAGAKDDKKARAEEARKATEELTRAQGEEG